ncbi:MAG: ABC transporter ATP-binding protein [Thermoanaerobaculaceae bacterium]|jgi:ABC-2 type transport system ATP-binding protein|nr:ABC transporter ATP-binding protein [Thermoanaerobaculaceae bacterium]
MDSAILVEHVAKTYRGIRRHTKVLTDVSLRVEQGEVYGLIGPNGAGKTTLMLTCLGLLRPERGEVRILGMEPGSVEARREIGYVPENVAYYPYLSARRFLDLCGAMSGLPEERRRTRAGELAERLGLAEALGTSIRKFSRGMLQKLSLIQAALHDPRVYFLDEPTSGMDPLGVRSVRDFIDEQRAVGRTFFINSHQLTEVERVADRVAIMRRGAVTEVVRVRAERPCVTVALLDSEASGRSAVDRLDASGLPQGTRVEVVEEGVQVEAEDDLGIAAAVAAIVAAGGRIRTVVDSGSSLEDAFFKGLEQGLEEHDVASH